MKPDHFYVSLLFQETQGELVCLCLRVIDVYLVVNTMLFVDKRTRRDNYEIVIQASTYSRWQHGEGEAQVLNMISAL